MAILNVPVQPAERITWQLGDLVWYGKYKFCRILAITLTTITLQLRTGAIKVVSVDNLQKHGKRISINKFFLQG